MRDNYSSRGGVGNGKVECCGCCSCYHKNIISLIFVLCLASASRRTNPRCGPTEADGQFSVNWISDSDYSVLACRCREINVNTPPLPSILHGGGEGFIICNLHIAS